MERIRLTTTWWSRLAMVVATALVAVGAGCVPPPPSPVVAIQMEAGGSFFSMPWPSDTRRAPDGSLDLDGLPGVELLPGEVPAGLRQLFPGIIERVGSSLDGFGVNTAVYFRAEVGLQPSSFPTPSASTLPDSPVMLIDLDHPGERVPVLVDFQQEPDRNRPDQLLTVLPYPGHPLRESTRYAVALLRGLRPTSGADPLPAPLLDELDDPWSAGSGYDQADWDALRADRDELRTVLEATTDWNADDLLAFTAYTTQDVHGDAAAVAAAVEAAPPPELTVLDQRGCSVDDRAGGTETAALLGTVDLTRWQQGTYPYYGTGGEIVVGPDHRAVGQGAFDALFTARIPCGEPPASGWPLVTFINGTGGGFDLGSMPLPFTYEGYVVVSISPVYGAERGIVVTPELAALGIDTLAEAQQFTFYNFLNPVAVRTNTIQQMGENLQLLRALEHATFDGAPLGSTVPVGTDPARQVVTGQSQGAQTLPMVAAMRPSLAGVVASAGSGGISQNLAHAAENRTFLGHLTGDAEVLDELNPIVQVAQTLVEGGDGMNFPSATNYLHYHGRDDCVPEIGRYFAGATGLPLDHHGGAPAVDYGDPALEPARAALPAQGNVGGRTRVALELPGGHYVGYDQAHVNGDFLADIAAGVTPTVPDSGYSFGFYSAIVCAPGERWDVPPTRFGR